MWKQRRAGRVVSESKNFKSSTSPFFICEVRGEFGVKSRPFHLHQESVRAFELELQSERVGKFKPEENSTNGAVCCCDNSDGSVLRRGRWV